MAELLQLEQTLLETLRSLPSPQQEAVLNFAIALSKDATTITTSVPTQPLALSLQQIAQLPILQRQLLMAPYVTAMAADFESDPELTEFSALDAVDWED